MLPNEGNGWLEYKRLVLQQLEDLTDEVKVLRGEIVRLRVDVGNLKTQAAFWGGLVGLGASALFSFLVKWPR
jgi:hypothetical protein